MKWLATFDSNSGYIFHKDTDQSVGVMLLEKTPDSQICVYC